ncbi:MAG: hypothetical protein J6Y75_08970 [Spirochaetaceae bacterium]|nr:hypothetical protein [Spirochaetaceae bacterium]
MRKSIKLPSVISDGMILQRNSMINIWGWGVPSSTLKVSFLSQVKKTSVDSDGSWKVCFDTGTACSCGPFLLTVEDGRNSITVKDILLGDVWLCSGQSNMELPVSRVKDTYPEELALKEYPVVRQFKIPVSYEFCAERKDIDGGFWNPLSAETVEAYSATAYFFAKELSAREGVPLGLINASHGGSPVEAWFDTETLALYPELKKVVDALKKTGEVQRLEKAAAKEQAAWYRTIAAKDAGADGGGKLFDVVLPCRFEKFLTKESIIEKGEYFAGVLWFSKNFEISSEEKSLLSGSAKAWLGTIVDADTVYINGAKIGETTYRYPPRKYSVPAGVLKAGSNEITIRVLVAGAMDSGEFTEDKPFKIFNEEVQIDLRGQWQCRLGCRTEIRPPELFMTWKPNALFNSMIAPVIPYALRGVLWYQGESNDPNPDEYEERFSALIKGWRKKLCKASLYEKNELPFIFAQLPNFKPENDYEEDSWPLLRDAQRKTLCLPQTGMAVTIDCGEWNDLHPENKKPVGTRLAAEACRIAYGKTQTPFSPQPLDAAFDSGSKTVTVKLSTGNSSVRDDGKKLKTVFAAGSDKVFERVDAVLCASGSSDFCTIVFNWAKPEKPSFVRYAWAMNPSGPEIKNEAGLPASPFELCIS